MVWYCAYIPLFTGGTIAERGTYAELMEKKNGEVRELVRQYSESHRKKSAESMSANITNTHIHSLNKKGIQSQRVMADTKPSESHITTDNDAHHVDEKKHHIYTNTHTNSLPDTHTNSVTHTVTVRQSTKLVVKEHIQSGYVKRNVYVAYLRAFGKPSAIVIVFCFLCLDGSLALGDW